MPSKLSNVYDSLRTRLAALYSAKTVIPYPYSLADNPQQFLVSGYGIKIGSGSNSDLSTDYLHTVDRSFSVVITAEAYDLSTGNSGLITATKSLFDDLYDLKNDLLDLGRVNPMYQGEGIVYDNDNGLEEVASGEKRFLSLEAFFTFELTQEINQ